MSTNFKVKHSKKYTITKWEKHSNVNDQLKLYNNFYKKNTKILSIMLLKKLFCKSSTKDSAKTMMA